ncbi:antigen 5 like allergen Cul n 1 [Drosophila grimshawi]|uniref:Venom allergen-1 n=1 Tax=Drosophila grimshawi TaxID=7222 RepID=B4JLJ9_DROGR|nr:antigen 5 like allergen Cul n 1 [Drosophila grimshawi]EDW00452.1 GH12878 [Drosophila grimshawi]
MRPTTQSSQNSLLLLLLLLQLLHLVLAQNFCDPSLCSRGSRHIGCGHNGRFANGCRGEFVNINAHRGLILQLHNQRRNQIAGGGLSGFPSAVQMGTMSWDPILARLAAYNVQQCRMAHDQCRNTNVYRFSGQNLSVLFTRRNINTAQYLRQRIADWFDEYRDATRADIERFRSRGGPAIGHFTAMVNERNNRIGCAVARYTSASGSSGTLLACNYAVTNMINNPVYRPGRSASQCRAGRNPRYTNLCAANEVYSYNNWSG